MDTENTRIVPADNDKTTIEDEVFKTKEDRVTVSRSKLEQLKEIAEDDRLGISFWNSEKLFSILGFGIFFTGLGSIIGGDSYTLQWYLSLVFMICGLLFVISCLVRQREDFKKRNNVQIKLVKKFEEIINQMDTMAAVNESKRSNN